MKYHESRTKDPKDFPSEVPLLQNKCVFFLLSSAGPILAISAEWCEQKLKHCGLDFNLFK